MPSDQFRAAHHRLALAVDLALQHRAGAGEKLVQGPNTTPILAMIAKYTGLSPEDMKLAIAYFDGEARLDTQDVSRQVAWYKSQGLIKGDGDSDTVIDKRYVVALP